MEAAEAIRIVRTLAEGREFETEQPLPADSICRNPQAVKALWAAVKALNSQIERQSQQGWKRWTRAEEYEVCEKLRQGMSFSEIAKAHNRTVPSIIARLVRLKKIGVPEPNLQFPAA